MQSLADRLIRAGIEGANHKLQVRELFKKYLPNEERTLVVDVVNGISLGYGFYLDPKEGKLSLCNPQEMKTVTVRVPVRFSAILILLDPIRKESIMDCYAMGLMPGISGFRYLAHLRLLDVIFREMKKALQEYSGMRVSGGS